MVLKIEQSSPLQGALTMASRNEDDATYDDFPEESLRQHDFPTEDALSCYVRQPVYFPQMPSDRLLAFPYSYAIYAAVLPKEELLVNICYHGSPHQDVSPGESCAIRNESLCAISNVEEPLSTPVLVENRNSYREQLEFTFLTLRERLSSGQQSPSDPNQMATWTLDFPKDFCGRLIGKKGRNLRRLMHETKTHLSITEDEESERKQILTIYGVESQILEVVSAIEELFAEKGSVPGLRSSRALSIVHPNNSAVVARQMDLPIDIGVNVVISTVLNAGHFYLVMPRFCAVAFKNDLERQINNFYDSGHTPRLSLSSTLAGTFCVGSLHDKWFRVQIIGIFTTAGKAEVLLLDYGQFAILPFSSLRKMRADFLDVPFQAIECCLANIVPRGGDYFFSLPGTNVFQRLTEKKKLKVICRGIQSGISLVDLYSTDDNTSFWINQRLVELGVANWNAMAR